MKNFLRWSYNTLRATFVTIVVLLVVAYGALYLALSMPYFQNKIKAVGERELSEFLGTNVTIDGISIPHISRAKKNFLNGKSNLAKPYATVTEETTAKTVFGIMIAKVLRK